MRDRDMREPLFDYLEERFGRIRILEEKTMGKSRADIVMVTGDCLCGIEIKSDADTYARLDRQVLDYDRYYDRNIVVVGASHAAHIEEHVPEHWGIITAEQENGVFDFYELRHAAPNPKAKPARKLEILWRPELAELQRILDMPKYKDRSKAYVIAKITERVPEAVSAEELSRRVSEILFERDYTIVEETLREYRKGELQKAIEAEADPERRKELIEEQEKRAARAPSGRRRRCRVGHRRGRA